MRPRFPRSSLFALAVLALSCLSPASAAPESKLVRVWPEYRAEASFVRVAEYFGGKESAPETIVRSRPESRDGYYFLARVKSSEAVPGAMIALEYFVPGDDLARVQFFSVDLARGSHALLAGLTGADWPGAKVAPTAWRLRLLGSDGTELAREQSFLWSLPPAKAAATPPVSPPSPPAG